MRLFRSVVGTSVVVGYFKKILLNSLEKGSKCCEIGVWKGDFSQKILEIVQPSQLVLIDPWEFRGEYKGRWYGGKLAKSQKEMDDIFRKVKMRFNSDKKINIHRGRSSELVKKFKNSYFDFIYVDGDHTYQEVLEDLRNYFPKLKKGGILAGDDYFWGIFDGFPVRKAVKEFCKNNKLTYKLIGTQFVIVKR